MRGNKTSFHFLIASLLACVACIVYSLKNETLNYFNYQGRIFIPAYPVRPKNITSVLDIEEGILFSQLLNTRGLDILNYRRIHVIYPQLDHKPLIELESDWNSDLDGFQIDTIDWDGSFPFKEIDFKVRGGAEVWLDDKKSGRYDLPRRSEYGNGHTIYSRSLRERERFEIITGWNFEVDGGAYLYNSTYSGDSQSAAWVMRADDLAETHAQILNNLFVKGWKSSGNSGGLIFEKKQPYKKIMRGPFSGRSYSSLVTGATLSLYVKQPNRIYISTYWD